MSGLSLGYFRATDYTVVGDRIERAKKHARHPVEERDLRADRTTFQGPQRRHSSGQVQVHRASADVFAEMAALAR